MTDTNLPRAAYRIDGAPHDYPDSYAHRSAPFTPDCACLACIGAYQLSAGSHTQLEGLGHADYCTCCGTSVIRS